MSVLSRIDPRRPLMPGGRYFLAEIRESRRDGSNRFRRSVFQIGQRPLAAVVGGLWAFAPDRPEVLPPSAGYEPETSLRFSPLTSVGGELGAPPVNTIDWPLALTVPPDSTT